MQLIKMGKRGSENILHISLGRKSHNLGLTLITEDRYGRKNR